MSTRRERQRALTAIAIVIALSAGTATTAWAAVGDDGGQDPAPDTTTTAPPPLDTEPPAGTEPPADTTTPETTSPRPPATQRPTPTTAAPTTAPPTATTSTTIAAPSPPPAAPAPGPTTTTAPAPAPVNIPVIPEQLGHILATIRYLESRGDYTLPPNRGNASGAYQFITSTWNNYAGYPHAYLAPPHVQDQRAVEDVQRFLDQWDNDVSMIPVMWYFPLASRDPSWMDRIPKPENGNVLTVREYQTRWLGVFSSLSGQPVPPVLTGGDALARAGLPPGIAPTEDGRVALAFPVLGPARIAAPDCDTTDAADEEPAEAEEAERPSGLVALDDIGLCDANPPGIVFGVKLQPVLSVADGVVTSVRDEPGEPITVTVTDMAGRSYSIAGFNDDQPGTSDGQAPPHLRLTSLARVGSTVRAGQILGFMGDSDPLPPGVRADVPTDATIEIAEDDVAPHVKLTITELDGTPLDAYGPLIEAGFRQACAVDIGGWSVPPNGDGHEPVVVETTDTDRTIDSEWIITSTGQVTASGWAAMTYPTEGCTYTPPEAFGPGAEGWSQPVEGWDEPIDLPTPMWLSLAEREIGPSGLTPVLR